jgi:hypothetical protein
LILQLVNYYVHFNVFTNQKTKNRYLCLFNMFFFVDLISKKLQKLFFLYNLIIFIIYDLQKSFILVILNSKNHQN